MDFLEYGLKNKDSTSILRRRLAQILLAIERKRADLYEAHLDGKEIRLPEDPEADRLLLQKIREQVLTQSQDTSPDERF